MNRFNKIIAGTISALIFASAASAVNADDAYLTYDGMYTVPDLGAFLVPSGVHAPTAGFDWKYTFTQPDSSWSQNTFVDTAWTSGKGSFARGGSELNDAATNIAWPDGKSGLWARSSFVLKDLTQKNMLMFWGRWDDNVKVYINGKLAVDLFAKFKDGTDALSQSRWTAEYKYLGLSAEARNALVVGVNKIAVYAYDSGGGAHLNLGIVKNPAMANLPINGYRKNSKFDDIVNKLSAQMSQYGISAGSISIALDKAGVPDVFASAGIGYMKKDLKTPVKADSVFRLASIDKSFARAAIRKMISDRLIVSIPGQASAPLSYDTPVYPLLTSLLSGDVFPLDSDTAKNSITIREILDQTSGIFSDSHGNQGSALADLKWIYQQPLSSDRGKYRYNNHAHFVLRYLVHAISRHYGFGNYNDYIRNELLKDSDDKNYYIAWQDLSGRVSRNSVDLDEPWYNVGKTFWNNDSGLGHYYAGASSADACSKYMVRVPGAEAWSGGMQGTSTFCWRSDYVDNTGKRKYYSIALFLNGGFDPVVWSGKNPKGEDEFSGQIITSVESAIRSLPCTAWSTSGTTCL
jgi:hypothetical protein